MHTKDIFQVVRLVAAALAMLVISPLYGGYEKFIASRTGSGISGGTTLTIQDQWLSYMTANGTSNSLFFVKQANCNAILRFDQSRMDNFVPKWSLEVDYTIKIYDDKVQQVSTKSGTLSIDFDNAAKYEDEDYISFTGMYFKAVLTVDAVRYKVGSTTSTSLPVTFANDIFLDLEQHTERYYNLAASAAPFVYAQQVNDHKELPVSWGFVPGAEVMILNGSSWISAILVFPHYPLVDIVLTLGMPQGSIPLISIIIYLWPTLREYLFIEFGVKVWMQEVVPSKGNGVIMMAPF